MQNMQRVVWLVTVLFACAPASAQVATDEAAIRELATRWERAWNRHDMKELFSFLTEDADFVNVGARHWKGRQQIEAEHTSRLNQFRESTWSVKNVALQFIKPDVALVHIDWTLAGDKDPDGTPRQPRGGVFTWVVVKQGSEWLLRAAQNTNLGLLAAKEK